MLAPRRMSSLLRRSSIVASLSLTALLAWACTGGSGGASSGTSGSTGNASSSGGTDPIVSPAECTPQCVQKATACEAPANVAQERCASLCANSVTQSQVTCLMSSSCEELSEIESSADVDALCPKGGSSGGTGGTGGTSGSPGAFGDECKCEPDGNEGASEFACSGTGICSPGLWCVGTRSQGVDDGKCVGPRCCNSEEECAEKLGKQANCASGQVCACTRGDLECVGDNCTCTGGITPSSGLCWPQ